MNRRDFLCLAVATVAGTIAAVLGAGRGVEPIVTGLRRITSPEIVMTDYRRIISYTTGASWAALGEPGIVSPTIIERHHQLVELGLDRKQAYMQAVLEEGERIMESA